MVDLGQIKMDGSMDNFAPSPQQAQGALIRTARSAWVLDDIAESAM
jgi:hypothetical protein